MVEPLCQTCDDRIEEPRIALGFTTCWSCAPVDHHAPPWIIEKEEGPAE